MRDAERFGSENPLSVFLNGNVLGNVAIGEKLSVLVDAGTHMLHVDMDGCCSAAKAVVTAAGEHIECRARFPMEGIRRTAGLLLKKKTFFTVHADSGKPLDAALLAQLEEAPQQRLTQQWMDKKPSRKRCTRKRLWMVGGISKKAWNGWKLHSVTAKISSWRSVQ